MPSSIWKRLEGPPCPLDHGSFGTSLGELEKIPGEVLCIRVAVESLVSLEDFAEGWGDDEIAAKVLQSRDVRWLLQE